MDAPIISIYDMMVKRYRQQKKEEQLQQNDLFSGPDERQNKETKAGGDRITETKKPRWKGSLTKISTESKDKQSAKMSKNVITATHLTKKHTGILMPPLTKKEVLNKLIERMSTSSKKPQEKPVSNESSGQGTSLAEEDRSIPIVSIKKMKTKPKILKPVPVSASSNYRRRLAMSPRNISTMGTPKPKRERPIIKPKPVSNSKALKTDPNIPFNVRPKRRLPINKSKISIISKKEDIKSSSDENAVRYRL